MHIATISFDRSRAPVYPKDPSIERRETGRSPRTACARGCERVKTEAMEDKGRVLVVDDEKIVARDLEQMLREEGYDIVGVRSGAAALAKLLQEPFDVVLTELRLEKIDGMQVLKVCRDSCPWTETIMVTARATVETAVEAMRNGAFSYIAKPFHYGEICNVVAEAMDRVRRRRHLAELAEAKSGDAVFLTRTPAIERLLHTARQVAGTDCCVLVIGEQGTGRRALARYIHHHSAHAAAPFRIVRCTGQDEGALEELLFGAEAGGTLLLDEVESLSRAMQARLAMALDSGGAEPPRHPRSRIVSTTSSNLADAVRGGGFRPDLHLLLATVTLSLQTLVQRKDDIALLAMHFLAKEAADSRKPAMHISDDAMELLLAYGYPGNVRELETVIRGAVAACDGELIDAADLPPSLRDDRNTRGGRLQTLEERERDYVLRVLREVNGNQTLAARVLGIDRVSLWRKLKRYEVAPR